MAWSAASARALLTASPIALVEPTTRGERITEWLKITAVPLLVFLIGTCIWGCLKNTAAWRVLTEDDGGSAHNELPDEVRSDSPSAISNNEAAKGEQVGEQIACATERLGGQVSLAYFSRRGSTFSSSCADLETGLELSQVRCRDEGSAAVA